MIYQPNHLTWWLAAPTWWLTAATLIGSLKENLALFERSIYTTQEMPKSQSWILVRSRWCGGDFTNFCISLGCFYMFLYVSQCFYMFLYVSICLYMFLYVSICFYIIFFYICFYGSVVSLKPTEVQFNPRWRATQLCRIRSGGARHVESDQHWASRRTTKG